MPISVSGDRGRPRYHISSCSVPPGARISLLCWEFHREQYGGEHSLNASSAYSDMCDGDLDEHVLTIQLAFPIVVKG